MTNYTCDRWPIWANADLFLLHFYFYTNRDTPCHVLELSHNSHPPATALIKEIQPLKMRWKNAKERKQNDHSKVAVYPRIHIVFSRAAAFRVGQLAVGRGAYFFNLVYRPLLYGHNLFIHKSPRPSCGKIQTAGQQGAEKVGCLCCFPPRRRLYRVDIYHAARRRAL